jgi:hypothetical protein
MPKVTLSTIGSRYGSIDALNANFASIEQAIENTLSRDGESPNAMQSNLNMDGYSILNAVLVSSQDIVVNGQSIADAVASAASSASAALASELAAASSESNAAISAASAAANALLVEDAKLIWRGQWDSLTAYEVNDAVVNNGTSYIAILDNTNQEPPNASFWDILALRGTDGASGSGSGDVSSVDSVSVDNEIALFSGTSGKIIKRAVGTGLVKINSGVLATAVAGTDYVLPSALADFISRTAATGSAILPTGTTAQRDGSPLAGYLRFNTSLTQFEGYNGTAWGAVGGGATGAPGNAIFYENDQIVSGDYTIPATKNAMTAGPIEIDTGVTVTVSSGATWTIV